MLKFREPLKHGGGRAVAGGFRYLETEIPWQPQFVEEFIELIEALNCVLAAIAADNLRAKGEDALPPSPLFKLPALPYRAVLLRGPNGIATLRPDPYAQFLEDLDGTDTGRIRRCVVCSTLFYAHRGSLLVCSARCSSVERARRSRARSSRASQGSAEG